MREFFSGDGHFADYCHRGFDSNLRYFVPAMMRRSRAAPACLDNSVQSVDGSAAKYVAAKYLLFLNCAWREDSKVLLRRSLKGVRFSDRYLVEQLASLRAISSLARNMSVESLVLAHAGLVSTPLRGIRERATWCGTFHSVHQADWLYLPMASVSDYLENLVDVCAVSGDLGQGFLCAVHFQLTAIHPFLDGNGRIARILVAALAVRSGKPLLDACALLLMTVFYRRRLCAYQRDAMSGETSALMELWGRMSNYAQRLADGIRSLLEKRVGERAPADEKALFQGVLGLALTYRDVHVF